MSRDRWLVVVLTLAIGAAVVVVPARGRRWWIERQAVEATRWKVIDDFNDGADPNLIGGATEVIAEPRCLLQTTYQQRSTPTPGRMALALDYRLAPAGRAAWQLGLNALDISAAEELVLWLSSSRAAPALRLILMDEQGHQAVAAIPGPLAPNQWRRIVLPMTAFTAVDSNHLHALRLVVEGGKEPAEGTIWVDDVAFRGPPELFFRSLRDNLYAFPARTAIAAQPLLRLSSQAMLRRIAQDTWKYFRDAVDARHHLPLNYLEVRPRPHVGDYVSPTDMAMYLLAVVSADDLKLLDHDEAEERLRATLQQIAALPMWRGFLYNYYSTTNLQITRPYVSSVDNGWLAGALIVVRQAFPKLSAPCATLLDGMDFGLFYDPQVGQMRVGYNTEREQFEPYHYGLLATEARLMSLIAIGKGDVPEEHWFRIYRTLPKEWTWQRQQPQGSFTAYRGRDLFQGYYTYAGVPFVPSWGGSLFEFLMPTLLADEQHLAPLGLGLNNRHAVELHRRYGLEERKYPAWGLSPSATPENRHGGYAEFGVPYLGAKGYQDEGVVTPHVSFLALDVAPQEAVENIRAILRAFPIYGEYGLYDAVDVHTGAVAQRYLALDQGMTLVALNNYLNNGAIRRRFHADPIVRAAAPLLQAEVFFEGAAQALHVSHATTN